jgi:hypothetical protein
VSKIKIPNYVTAMAGGRPVFDRQADGRAKTGRAAIGIVSK